MPFSVLLFASRKPGLSPAAFRDHWENKHVPLVKSITGSHFPISHTRRYIARTEGGSSGGPANPETPAVVLVGKQEDFDYDGIAELTFSDESAFQTFFGIVSAPDAAAKISEDEDQFLDKSKLKAVVIGDTTVTNKT
ncbi:hypothetical protein AOQ84DRAFT_122374 [Glonium stellatum]|uniref:EthD domain-containing protein n=1 Tax=Glonium stellatum TaxID=574774 RepID=A0A8E2ESX2_9PEZI|nr:hypothetical protein AOQ84DRAFT_122374 [Glonium stellatum]